MLRSLAVIAVLGANAVADPAPPEVPPAAPAEVAPAERPPAAPRESEFPVQLEAAFAAGFPAALPTGLSRGVAAGASVGDCPFRLGVRVAWMTATESSESWEVTNTDLHLRGTAGVEQVAGRGSFGLRLGFGGTLVHESRMRQQGARAGLMGSDLETSAWAMLPAADLEAVIDLGVYEDWHLVISGGPSIALVDQQPTWSWISQVGIGWRR